MISRINQFFVITIVTILANACFNSSNAPQKLDSFVDNTELNCNKYDAEDWQKSIEQYEKLVEDLNKPGRQYTDAEKQMAARAMGRYHSLLIKNGIEQSASYLEELNNVLPSYLEGLVEGLGEDSEGIKRSLDGIIGDQELEKAFEGLGEKLEELFSRIEKE